MEKFWRLLYYYCLGGFVIGVVYLTTMLFIAPRQDALKRGFIPCTEKLVLDISSCERGKISCPMGYLWQDMKCNVKVVLNGFGAWVKGEQKTPWANYLFEPKALAEIDEETPYVGNVAQDMDNLEEQIEFIKAKQAELEEAKNRQLEINENITMSDPEENVPSADKKTADKPRTIAEENAEDIADEAFEDTQWESDSSHEQKYEQPQKDIIKQINEKTAEQLGKEEIKDEK